MDIADSDFTEDYSAGSDRTGYSIEAPYLEAYDDDNDSFDGEGETPL